MREANGWLTIADSFAALSFARGGFDSVTLDMQHGFYDPASVAATLLALAGTSVRRFVRPPSNDAVVIGKLLDLGADGLIVPMISSVNDAEILAAACRYPPDGERSFGPMLPARDVVDGSPRGPEVFAMIETRAGLDAVEAIAAVEGLSGVFVGPNDLALALGLGPGSDREEPMMQANLARIAAAAAAAGKRAGLFCASPFYAARMAGLGYDFLTLAADAGTLTRAGAEAVTAFRNAAAP